MKFAPGFAVAAATLLGSGFAARAEDEKPANTQTKTIEEKSSTTQDQFEHGKKKASKRQQLQRGAGPVGDEGTATSKSVRSSASATSTESGPGVETTHRKVTKKTQIRRGAGPEGTEGAAAKGSNDAKADQPKQ